MVEISTKNLVKVVPNITVKLATKSAAKIGAKIVPKMQKNCATLSQSWIFENAFSILNL